MKGSKGGSDVDPTDDFAARIGASISAGHARQNQAGDALKQPRPVVRQLKTLSPQSGQPAAHDDELSEDDSLEKLPAPLEANSVRPDLLWVLTAFVVLILLAGSFIAFMMVTSVKPDEVKVSTRFASSSPSPSDGALSDGQTWMIGDGHLPSPSPSPEATPAATPTPVPTPEATATPVPQAVLTPPPVPAASLAPPPIKPALTPPPIKPPTLASKAPVKPPETGGYQVIVGPYDNRGDADASSADLGDLGKNLKVEQEKDKYFVLVGDVFSSQDQALGLAEQVVQRGKQVTVKKQ